MATDRMTVKIAPHGNRMTSMERRFSDQEIAQAATPTRSTESSALEHPAFERHYRIGELAEVWQLGRERVRLLVKDERGVIRIRHGRKKAHTIYSVPESVAVRIHTPAEQPLALASAWHGRRRSPPAEQVSVRSSSAPAATRPCDRPKSHRLRLVPVSFLEHSGQSFLPLRDPGAVMQRDRLRAVAECHRDLVNGVSVLEESSCKGVAEAVRGRLLLEGATVTLIHYAEYLADVTSKRRVRRHRRVAPPHGPEIREVECLDDRDGIFDWPGEDYFSVILKDYLATHEVSRGLVGRATSELIPARDLVTCATRWMTTHFAGA